MAPMGRIGGSRIGALLLTGSLLALSGCSPVGMAVGAGATVTNMAMEERGFVTSAKDKLIWTRDQQPSDQPGSEAVREYRRSGP